MQKRVVYIHITTMVNQAREENITPAHIAALWQAFLGRYTCQSLAKAHGCKALVKLLHVR
jgi:hypothetical protein